MTYEDRFVRERAWLKTDHFAVTKSLRAKLEASGLPAREQSRSAYIQNKVLVTAKERQWAQISSRYWSDKCDSGYTRYRDQLCDWGQLRFNRKYLATHDANGYPMSYLVPSAAMRDGICNVNFGRERFHAPTPDNTPTDDASRYALKCLWDLKVVKDTEFWLPTEPTRRSRVKDHCEHIAYKDFGLTYGNKSKRLFHRVVMMPAEGRRNLKHDFLPLVEYDVKSCHPLLLVTLFEHDGERRRYQDLLAGDIYTAIGDAMGTTDREQVKTDFLRVVNAGRKSPKWLRGEYVFQFFQERFPHFAKSVLSNRTDLAIYLQNFEAGLMVQRLGEYCRTENLFWIPQHDGWISTVGDDEKIRRHADTMISQSVGFSPTLTKHLLKSDGGNPV
ncbi:MAG TPA: hypothetical protein P5038_00485 [Candidatus Paceibacterota bacterium]|nr:hypothetical protein [Candidatus Paceibacterota bacterium]HRT55080.1 hypothetical protein [Candidatus Paceibacterota bacterium]